MEPCAVQTSPARMPSLFVGHGSPMNLITDNPYRSSWEALGRSLPRPEAVLCVSAHWETDATAVTMAEPLRTIHDFGGFPPALHAQQYPVPSAARWARETIDTVRSVRIAEDRGWGLDHGAWCVLKPMYPAGDVPVFQLSIDATRPVRWHFELGRELSALRERGVLLLGSGNIVHNLRMLRPGAHYEWAGTFDRFVVDCIERNAVEALLDDALFEGAPLDNATLGAAARLAVPTREHFLPLLYVLGARQPGDRLTVFNQAYELGALSMTSVLFSDR